MFLYLPRVPPVVYPSHGPARRPVARAPDTDHIQSRATVASSQAPDENPWPTIPRVLSEIAAAAKALLDNAADRNAEPE